MPPFAWSVAILLSLLASSVLADIAPVAAPISAILANVRLLGLGVPTQTQLRFTHVGWRPRWPFC